MAGPDSSHFRRGFLHIVLTAAVFVLATTWQLTSPPGGRAQEQTKSLAERLGYPRDARLLIIHGDDLGMAHSIDAATIKAFETGLVNSASIMVPCPWFLEIAAYARSHPEADLGLHLTLTSEWEQYRWGPVTSKDRVSSLLDPKGYLYPSEAEAAARIDVREAEIEIRAQIERARAFGVQPTHLDSHMGTLYGSKALFEMFLKVAREYKLPVRVARDWGARADYLRTGLRPDDVAVDRVISITPNVPPERWATFYSEAIKNLEPGVTEMVIHLAYDDEEMRGVTINHPDWGAAWRQRDFDFFTSAALRRILEENKVQLITWRQIGRLIAGNKEPATK